MASKKTGVNPSKVQWQRCQPACFVGSTGSASTPLPKTRGDSVSGKKIGNLKLPVILEYGVKTSFTFTISC